MNTSDTIGLIIQWIIPIQMFISQFLYTNANSTLSYYLFSKGDDNRNYNNYSNELDRMQINRLLKWLHLFFEQYPPSPEEDNENSKNNIKHQYIKELYQLYKTILSDYNQYVQCKIFNESLWLLRTYRAKSTNDIAKKIISDVTLFNEGLTLFSKI
jgi:hypothetical protein